MRHPKHLSFNPPAWEIAHIWQHWRFYARLYAQRVAR